MAKRIKVGELTQEGIYIGRLEDKDGVKRDYFAAPTDAQDESGNRLSLSFNAAAQYAKNATVLGHNDWVVPAAHDDKNGAPDVLNALYKNSNEGAFYGTFNDFGLDATETYDTWRCYWSSSSFSDKFRNAGEHARLQIFDVNFMIEDAGGGNLGRQTVALKSSENSVRLVRSVAVK